MTGYQAGIRAYENATNPIDEQVSPWDGLNDRQVEDLKLWTLRDLQHWGEADWFGVTVSFDNSEELENIASKASDELGEDWLAECLETPYSEKHGEYKERLWDAFCDAVDEELNK